MRMASSRCLESSMCDAETPLIRAFANADEASVLDLWRACDLVRSWNDPRKDIARKLGMQPELFLVCEVAGEVVASAMGGYEGHRGWVNYLAVHPRHQRKGLGRELMAALEERLLGYGCPKINLQVRATNASVRNFYEALGYRQDEVVSYGKRLISDE